MTILIAGFIGAATIGAVVAVAVMAIMQIASDDKERRR